MSVLPSIMYPMTATSSIQLSAAMVPSMVPPRAADDG